MMIHYYTHYYTLWKFTKLKRARIPSRQMSAFIIICCYLSQKQYLVCLIVATLCFFSSIFIFLSIKLKLLLYFFTHFIASTLLKYMRISMEGLSS